MKKTLLNIAMGIGFLWISTNVAGDDIPVRYLANCILALASIVLSVVAYRLYSEKE